jgi:hypothetical protein
MKSEFRYYDGPRSAAYYADLYAKYHSVRTKLVTVGRALLNDPSIVFDPYDLQWKLPAVEFPLAWADMSRLPPKGSYDKYNGPTSFEVTVTVEGGNFSRTNGYQFSVDTNCCNCTMASIWFSTLSEYDAKTNSHTVTLGVQLLNDDRGFGDQVINMYEWGEYQFVLTDIRLNKELLRVNFHNPPIPMGNCN